MAYAYHAALGSLLYTGGRLSRSKAVQLESATTVLNMAGLSSVKGHEIVQGVRSFPQSQKAATQHQAQHSAQSKLSAQSDGLQMRVSGYRCSRGLLKTHYGVALTSVSLQRRAFHAGFPVRVLSHDTKCSGHSRLIA